GAVQRNDTEEIEFRCPKQRCPSRGLHGRSVLLDPELVEQLMSSFGESLTELAALALAGYQKSSMTQLSPPKMRRTRTIWLTSSQNYFFSDADIEAALWQLVEEKH